MINYTAVIFRKFYTSLYLVIQFSLLWGNWRSFMNILYNHWSLGWWKLFQNEEFETWQSVNITMRELVLTSICVHTFNFYIFLDVMLTYVIVLFRTWTFPFCSSRWSYYQSLLKFKSSMIYLFKNNTSELEDNGPFKKLIIMILLMTRRMLIKYRCKWGREQSKESKYSFIMRKGEKIEKGQQIMEVLHPFPLIQYILESVLST